jgi:AbrB family looped-hinge helix DNA binding protein
MKIGNIATTNQKGQLVIPATVRKQLGITDQVPLHITVKGGGIYIEPIRDFVTFLESENSYADVLRKTQGSWKNEPSPEMKRKKIELLASTKRKKAW